MFARRPGRAARVVITAIVLPCLALALPCLTLTPRAHALTLEEALALAARDAPAVLRADAEVRAARGGLDTAEVLLAEDPVLHASGGPRYTLDGALIPQVQVGLAQRFELSGARGARIEGARASIEEAEANRRESAREAMHAAGSAFLEALHARDAVAHATTAREQVDAHAAIIAARIERGDVGAIEVHRVRLAAARARGDEHAAHEALARATGALRALLGLEAREGLALEGSLEAETLELEGEAARAELDVLRARGRVAAAEAREADALAVPQLEVGLGYQHEEGDHMGLLTLALTLPVLDRGRGARASADARREGLERVLDARAQAIRIEVDAAREALRSALAALAASQEAIEEARALDALMARSLAAGEAPLTEVLATRAEVQTTLRAHLDRQRAVGGARLALMAALGAVEPAHGETR